MEVSISWTFKLTVYSLGLLWLLWYLYILVMGLYRAKLNGQLKGLIAVLAAPAIIVGFVVDVLANLTACWWLFRDPPREWLMTARMNRYLSSRERYGWRHDKADKICHKALDPFDPSGKHCKRPTDAVSAGSEPTSESASE